MSFTAFGYVHLLDVLGVEKMPFQSRNMSRQLIVSLVIVADDLPDGANPKPLAAKHFPVCTYHVHKIGRSTNKLGDVPAASEWYAKGQDRQHETNL